MTGELLDRVPRSLNIALDFIRRGWKPLPVGFRKKKPTAGESWPTFICTAETASRYFYSDRQNVGVLLGASSGGLTDIDLDDDFARILAPAFLPETGAIFGRTGSPRSHWLYIADTKTTYFKDPTATQKNKAMLVEIRSTGAQTVFPGSVHKSGELIEWDLDGEPSRQDNLPRAVGRLASAALLARHWNEGSRDVIAAALAGILLRAWTPDETRNFIGAIAKSAGDEEHEQRERKADRASGRQYGWPTFRECLGDAITDSIGRWLELDSSEDIVRDLNRDFAVVAIGGRAVVLRESDDRQFPGTKQVDYWRVGDFHLWFANRRIRRGERDVQVSRIWLESEHRRQYDGVIFEPGNTETHAYNLWQGWRVVSKPGSWKHLQDHLFDNVADSDDDAYQWLLAFMAHAIQSPHEPPGVSPVLRGIQGAGKGIVWNALGWLFGRHYIQVTDPRHIVGNFNAHLEDKLLIFVDEGFFAGDRRHAAVLKGMITEPRVIIERKGIDAFSIPNLRHIVFASNEDWVVPAALQERRFAVFDVNSRHAQDRTYFGAIVDELQAGGYAAMFYDLQRFDPTSVDLSRLPNTSALWDQKRLSLDPAQTFWYERLLGGEQIPVRGWQSRVLVADLVRAYAEALNGAFEKRAVETKLGMALRKLCPGMKYVRTKQHGQTLRLYAFPDLETSRRQFEDVVRTPVNWLTGRARARI